MNKIVCLAQLAITALLFLACGSSQKVPQASKSELGNPYGTAVQLTEVEEYAMAAPGKRAYGKGVSASESAARQMAELDARAQMSRALDNAIVSASKLVGFDITQYAGGDTDGMSVTDRGEQRHQLQSEISSNIIAGTNVVKMNKFYGQNRQFTIFVCIEYDGTVADIAKKAAEQVRQRVSDADRAKIDQINGQFEAEVEKKLKEQK